MPHDLSQRLQTDHPHAARQAATLEESITHTLRTLGELTGFEMGQVWRPSRDGQTLRCLVAAYHAVAPEQLAPFRRVSVPLAFARGEGLLGKAWAQLEPVWLDDLSQDLFVRAPKAAEVGLRAGFAFPVKSGDDVLAVFELYTTRPQPRPAEFLDALASLAPRLGEIFSGKHPLPQGTA